MQFGNQQDLVKQVDYFKEIGKHLEAKRLEERTNFDLEMIRELGIVLESKITRVILMAVSGTRPFCLLDYFPKDYLMVVDENRNAFTSKRYVWRRQKPKRKFS
jgi:excinuclease ABC subunit B